MKNEPVVTYNHMDEDDSSGRSHGVGASHEKDHHPISLYMILIVDVILIGAVIFIALKTIF